MGQKPLEASTIKPCKILIIDDAQDDVEILADVLKTTGVKSVHYVYTAMQAFALEPIIHYF